MGGRWIRHNEGHRRGPGGGGRVLCLTVSVTTSRLCYCIIVLQDAVPGGKHEKGTWTLSLSLVMSAYESIIVSKVNKKEKAELSRHSRSRKIIPTLKTRGATGSCRSTRQGATRGDSTY